MTQLLEKACVKFNKKLVLLNEKRWVDCEAVRRRNSQGIIRFNARGHVFSHGLGPSHHNYSCFIKVYPVHAWNYSYSITGFEALSEAMGTVVFVWTCPCRCTYVHSSCLQIDCYTIGISTIFVHLRFLSGNYSH